MPLPADTDVSTPKYLRDKYAIVGVGETTYTRGSGKTTRALGTWALRNAIADAGLKASDIDGMLSYSGNDSTPSTFMAGDIGARLNFYMDCMGGGSSTEALIGIAIGVMEAGLCNCVAIFRAKAGGLRLSRTIRLKSSRCGSASMLLSAAPQHLIASSSLLRLAKYCA